jgi:hypothetical protein
MGVENATIIEVEQLMLSTPLDARDTRADERAELRRLEPTLQRRMQHAHSGDGAAACASAQHLERGFDFW